MWVRFTFESHHWPVEQQTFPVHTKEVKERFGFALPSTLSEHEVPMPVSPLSDAVLWRRAWLPLLGAEGLPCHPDSQPDTHPGLLVQLEPTRRKMLENKIQLLMSTKDETQNLDLVNKTIRSRHKMNEYPAGDSTLMATDAF